MTEKWLPNLLIYLRPTMPLQGPEEILRALGILEENSNVDCVRTTAPVSYPPYWMKKGTNMAC